MLVLLGIAVVLVAGYLLLNAVVIGHGLYDIVVHPRQVPDWWHTLRASRGGAAM